MKREVSAFVFVIAYRLCKQGTAIQTSHHDGKVKIPKNYVANPRTEETPSGKKMHQTK